MFKNFLEFVTIEDNLHPGDWRVEAIDNDGDGEVFTAVFVGPEAQRRAEEYATWKNVSQREVQNVA